MNPFTSSRGRAAHLLARHLRFHRHLLALRRHTADPPELARPEDWTPWLSQRQHLLDALAACDGPRLAAETDRFLRASGDHSLAPMLRALQARQLAMMQSLLALENMLRRALAGHQLTLTRQATFARQASFAHRTRIARASYRGKHSEATALDQHS